MTNPEPQKQDQLGEQLQTQNETLAQISEGLFGGRAELRIVVPSELVLLEKNARFFKKNVFQQLVSNVKKDKRLSSVPLCRPTKEDKLEVLSGNHRVQAAVEAKLDRILVIVITEDLTREEQIAIQLSHNALVGEDDQKLLSSLWAEMEGLEAKLYAGFRVTQWQRLAR